MFILVYLAKTGEVKFINGTGFAPMAATVDFYKGKGGLPDEGPLRSACPARSVPWSSRQDLRHAAAVRDPRTRRRAGRTRVSRHRGARRRACGAAARSCKAPSSRKIWFNGDRPLEMGERVVQKDLAATLREIGENGSAGVLSRPDRAEVRRLHEERRRPGRREGSRVVQGVRRHADSHQLQGHRGLRVPAELAGPRHAAGAEHPRGDEPPLHAAQQRAVSARGHRSAEAVVRRSQPLGRRSQIRAADPDPRAALEGIRGCAPRADRPRPRHRG